MQIVIPYMNTRKIVKLVWKVKNVTYYSIESELFFQMDKGKDKINDSEI